jgi:uncharacterized protein YndB with AHSA1/START domain
MTFEAKGRQIAIERIFDAPRELVWSAWTDCEHLQHWWGPTGWTLPVCKLDLRVGGVWHYCMRSPDGKQDSWGISTYREIVEPERLVLTDAFSDEQGTVAADMPEMLNTITFQEEGGKTRVTSTSEYGSAEELQRVIEMGVEQGVKETWDRLVEYLATMK